MHRFIIIIILLLAVTAYSQLPGDFNCNGEVMTSDIAFFIRILNCSIDSLEECTIQNGDLDGDGLSLTVSDFTMLYYYFTGGPYNADFPRHPDQDTLIIGSTDASPGEYLTIPIYINTIDTLTAFQLNLVADSNYLTLDSVSMVGDFQYSWFSCFDNIHIFAFDYIGPIILLPGSHHIGNLHTKVNRNINQPVTTTIEFADIPEHAIYTGLANLPFFRPVLVNSEITITLENTPPLIDPYGLFTLPYDCGYIDFQAELEVIDNEGDSITVTTSIGGPVMTDFYVDGEGVSHWLGYIEFDMEDFCGSAFEGNLEITAYDEEQSFDLAFFGPITIIGKITASMEDRIYVLPGLEEWMPVYLDVAECFCLGAFDFTIEFDASVLAVTDVMRGDIIMGGEYFNFTYGLGIVNVSFINDLDDGNPAEDICGIEPEEPIFCLKFLLNPEHEYPIDFTIPVCFRDDEPYYTFNDIIDKDGEYIWFSHGCEGVPDSTFLGSMLLNLECGYIRVLSDSNIVIGDLNMNGIPYEVGDFVVGYNAIMECWSLNQRQRYSADIDQDDNPLTIADLWLILYVINGGGLPPDSSDTFFNHPLLDTLIIALADASPGEQLTLPVYLKTVDTLIELQSYFISDTNYITLDSIIIGDDIPMAQTTCSGNPHLLTLTDNFMNDTLLIYPGTYYLGDLIAHVNPDIQAPVTTYIEFSNTPDSLLYTGLANPTFFEPVTINSEIHIIPTGIDTDKNAGLPVSLTLKAYPNPFNSNLKITVSCPIESELVIYDLLGRVVKIFPVNSGENSFTWDATDENAKSIGSGIYFVRVKGPSSAQVEKIVFLK